MNDQDIKRCLNCMQLEDDCKCDDKDKEIVKVKENWLQCPNCKELGIECCCPDVEEDQDE